MFYLLHKNSYHLLPIHSEIYLFEGKKNLTGMASIILLNLANPNNSFELIFSLSESRPQATFPDQMYS